jgi:Asp-tRNA(Asn)/Glu-tRNA(Gln) amidotransferase C subunit
VQKGLLLQFDKVMLKNVIPLEKVFKKEIFEEKISKFASKIGKIIGKVETVSK